MKQQSTLALGGVELCLLYVILLTALTALWVAFEIWLMVRDRAQGKGKTAKDRGTRYYNFIAIAVGLTLAGFLSGKTTFFFPLGKKLCSFSGSDSQSCCFLFLCAYGQLQPWVHPSEQQLRHIRIRRSLGKAPIGWCGILPIRVCYLTCLGYGIAVQNWLSLIFAVGLPLVPCFIAFILKNKSWFPLWDRTMRGIKRKTKKLIPWIW